MVETGEMARSRLGFEVMQSECDASRDMVGPVGFDHDQGIMSPLL